LAIGSAPATELASSSAALAGTTALLPRFSVGFVKNDESVGSGKLTTLTNDAVLGR